MNLLLILPLVAVVLLSGCTGTGQPAAPLTPSDTGQTVPTTGSGGGVTELSVAIAHGVGYTPSAFTVQQGQTVRLMVTSNPVAHNHGITIDEFEVNTAVMAGPGGTPQTIEFVADKAGTFKIYCKTCESGPLGAHPGMVGTLTVTA